MELLKNIQQIDDYQLEGEVYLALYQKYIPVYIEGSNIEFATKCAQYLNELPAKTMNHLYEASIRYCNDFLKSWDKPILAFDQHVDVLNLIEPIELSIPDAPDKEHPVICLESNCEWDPEHGVEWIIKEDKVLYVGSFVGIDPWSDPSNFVTGNYA